MTRRRPVIRRQMKKKKLPRRKRPAIGVHFLKNTPAAVSGLETPQDVLAAEITSQGLPGEPAGLVTPDVAEVDVASDSIESEAVENFAPEIKELDDTVAPTPAQVFMIQDYFVAESGIEASIIDRDIVLGVAETEIKTAPLEEAETVVSEAVAYDVQEFEAIIPRAQPVVPIEVSDLFDAQGNLVVPSGIAPSAAATEIVLSPAREPLMPEEGPIESPMSVGQVNLLMSRVDDSHDLAVSPASIVQPQPLHKINSLTVAGIFRVAVWPVKFLYWPFRLSALRHNRQIYEQQYHTEASVPGGGNVHRLNIGRLSLQFITACVVLLLPIQIAVYSQDLSDARDRVVSRSTAALEALKSGRNELASLRWYSATEYFRRAQTDFQLARDEYRRLDFFTKALLQIVPQGRRTVKAGLSLLSAGEGLAEIGRDVSSDIAAVSGEEGWQDLPALLTEVNSFQQSLSIVLPKVAYARTALANVDLGKIPLDNRDSFLSAANTLPQIEATLLDTEALTRAVLQLLGSPRWQRYLVLFQNNSELRATGGFVGSYALVDIEDGKIINFEIPSEGSYQLQGQLRALVASPEPMQIVKSRWEFQDSNWWPDFPFSAQKAAWFYEESGGPSVDGVIALTNTMLERMLKVVGPISMPEYGRTIDMENFTLETQKVVEFEYDKSLNRPKQFLADLAPKILERVMQLSGDQQRKLLSVFYEGLQEKQLMFYSRNPQAQEIFEQLDWAGRMQPVGLSDYLMLVSTNIGGGKTDRVVATDVEHGVHVTENGSLDVTLTIDKTHQGSRGDPFTGMRNNSYLRVYVPAGAVFLGAEGFAEPNGAEYEPVDGAFTIDADLLAIEGKHQRDPVSGVDTYQEAGKTVFAHWLSVEPGERKSATLRYRLPFTLAQASNAYTLLVQKQPGTIGDHLISIVQMPSGKTLARTYPLAEDPRLKIAESSVTFTDQLVTDKFYGVVFDPGSK